MSETTAPTCKLNTLLNVGHPERPPPDSVHWQVTFVGGHVYLYWPHLNVKFQRVSQPSRRVFSPPIPVSDTLSMALVDFYRQSGLFNRPHNPNPPSDFLTGSTTRLVYDGAPSDDLKQHGVFVDIEDFMKSVLHVPADWRARWGPVIRVVKCNPDFTKHYFKYRVYQEQ